MTVTGQVDQGSSANKGMRLLEALSNYSDDGKVTYNTDASRPPALTISLKSIPTGTLEVRSTAPFIMSGGLGGQVSLALTFAGQMDWRGRRRAAQGRDDAHHRDRHLAGRHVQRRRDPLGPVLAGGAAWPGGSPRRELVEGPG